MKSLKRKVHRRRNNAKGPVLVEKLSVIVDTLHRRSMRSIATKMGISERANCEEDSAGGYLVEVLCHAKRTVMSEAAVEKAKTPLAPIKHTSDPYQLVFFVR